MDSSKGYDPDIADSGNVYNHNNQGRFCSCDKPYNEEIINAEDEEEGEGQTMIQCGLGDICGEDWFHVSCLLGKGASSTVVTLQNSVKDETPSSAHTESKNETSTAVNTATSITTTTNNTAATTSTEDKATALVTKNIDEKEDAAQLQRQPMPIQNLALDFPPLESFDMMICWKCYSANEKALLLLSLIIETQYVERNPTCIFTLHDDPENNFSHTKSKRHHQNSHQKSIFLPYGYKEKLLNYHNEHSREATNSLMAFLNKFPFMYQPDPIYEPEKDTDLESTYELGLREMEKLPSDQAYIGIKAIDKLHTKLKAFLEPFAKDGNVVTKEAVTEFFDIHMKQRDKD